MSTHLERVDEKLRRARERLARLQAGQDRDTATSAQTGWDIGGIRTRAGRRSAGQRLDRTIDQAKEIVALQSELGILEAHRRAYAAGEVDARGWPVPPSGERLGELIETGERMLARGTDRHGAPYTPSQRAALEDTLRRYQQLQRREQRRATQGEQR